MTITTTLIPAEINNRSTLPQTDPRSRVVTFTARPSRRPWAVGQDLLAALGVRLDLAGSGRQHNEDLEYACAWLTAYNVRLVVVRHADNIAGHRRTVLDSLHDLCRKVGADLALTADDTIDADLLDWTTDHDGSLLPFKGLQRKLQRVTETPQRARTLDESHESVTDQGQDSFPVHLPRTDFTLFRTVCRDTLRTGQFALVEALYLHARAAALAAAPTTAEDAASHFAALVDADLTRAQALVLARGTQAGVFMTGYLLKINIDAFLTAVTEKRNRRLTAAEIRSLVAYRAPWRGAAMVLYDADLARADISALTLADVDSTGNVATTPHRLCDDARRYLRAQVALRRHSGAAPTDPLIDVPATTLSLGLRRVASDLGLPATNRRLDARVPRSSHWRYQLGVALTPLTGPIAPAKSPSKPGVRTVASPRPTRRKVTT